MSCLQNASVYIKGESISYDQGIAIIEAAIGKKLEVTRITPEALNDEISKGALKNIVPSTPALVQHSLPHSLAPSVQLPLPGQSLAKSC